MDDFNVPSPIQPIRDVKSTHEVHSPLMSSDPDETVFRNSPPQFHNTQEFECQEEEKKFSTESVNKRRPVVQSETKFPAVKVGVGKELRQYPGLNEEMFEKLRELQGVLAAVTDENRLKKIVSIVRKSGNFTMVGNAVDFDLCSLDRKTIHRIQKHLKVS
uniref:AF-9 ANC1 homology domain-containing protein n=1 Tax=Ciona savignyi TaxID=51511 RepID=H2YCR0_CIOSA